MVARWYGKQGQTPVNTQDYHVKVHGGHKMSYETLRLVKQLNISNFQEKYTFLAVSRPYVQSTPQILDMLFTDIGWSLLKQKVCFHSFETGGTWNALGHNGEGHPSPDFVGVVWARYQAEESSEGVRSWVRNLAL